MRTESLRPHPILKVTGIRVHSLKSLSSEKIGMSRRSGSLGITVKYKNDWFTKYTKHIHKQGSHSDHLDETISGIGNFGWFGHSEVSTMTSLAILGS